MEREWRLPPLSWDNAVTVEAKGREVEVCRLRGAHAGAVTDAILTAVGDALASGSVEHFLVERARDGSRVAVAESHLAALWPALRALGESGPFYVRLHRGDDSWQFLARDLPDPPTPADVDRVAVHVAVRDPASRLRLGREQACTLEVWSEDGDGGLATEEFNERTQEVDADDRRQAGEVAVGRGQVRVVPPFDRPTAFDVRFDVDAVILWVDGADPAWRAARDQRRRELGLPPADPGTAERLYTDHGELRYLLRSLERFAPWLRRIHLVTAGQQPAWLRTDHPWLRMVDHRDIIEPEALPVFSPRPVTSRMHRIEGLAEHFLYFNDDMLLGRSVGPERFFTANGLAQFFLSKSKVPRRPDDAPHLGGRQVVQRLVAEHYGVHIARTFRHTPYAMRRSTMELMEQRFGEQIEATVHRPFRSPHDIIPEWLHHYVGYLEGRSLVGKISYGYFPIGRREGLEGLEALLTDRKHDCFCLNDQGEEELSVEESERWMLDTLERLLPGAGSFETDGGVGTGRTPGPTT